MDLGRKIAYFSMEIGLESDIKTYSGGLGVLAGDGMKSAADLKMPMIGVSLLYKGNGYFTQRIRDNRQVEEYHPYDPRRHMTPLDAIVGVNIEGREVKLKSWLYEQKGVGNEGLNGFSVPILFLDSNNDLNGEWYDRMISDRLYFESPHDDRYWRIAQNIVLGIGGVKMLVELDRMYPEKFALPDTFHLNEGHGSFATLELLKMFGSVDKVKEKVVFTTHTPVEAGHDKFTYKKFYAMMGNYFSDFPEFDLRKAAGEQELNTTKLALHMSHYVNGVAKKHGEVSRQMFPDHDIDYITNGVHLRTWASPEMQKFVLDRHFPKWRENPEVLKDAGKIPDADISSVREVSKQRLIDYVNEHSSVVLDPDVITIGFARRFATYKRGDLLFRNVDRLLKICDGKVQFIYAGKAHPSDDPAKGIINNVLNHSASLRGRINIAFLENYNMFLGKTLTAGCDIWLNVPRIPNEACGTSGMKVAANAGLNLSILDGWWEEVNKVFGRYIGGWEIKTEIEEGKHYNEHIDYLDSQKLYEVMETQALPLFSGNGSEKELAKKRKEGLVLASHYNSHRMMKEYAKKAYGLKMFDEKESKTKS